MPLARRSKSAIAAVLLLSACAGVPAPPYLDPDDLPAVLAGIKERQQQYAAAAARWDDLEPLYSLPMIGAAAAGVATAFYVHNPAKTNILQALGIGAGTYALGWSVYDPVKRETAYRLGLRQTGCLYQAGLMLSDQSNPALAAKRSQLADASEEIGRANAEADRLLASAPAQPSTEERLALVMLTQARANAAAALDTAAAELDIANHPGAYLTPILTRIDNQIYADARGRMVSLADALSQITATAGTLTAQRAGAPPPGGPSAAPPASLAGERRVGRAPPTVADQATQLAARLNAAAETINANKAFVAIKTKAEACALLS
jgi:hypothetical protein